MEFTWLFFALVTPLLWANNNVLDGLAMSKLVRNEYVYAVLSCFARFPIVLILLFFVPWYTPSPIGIVLALAGGFLNIFPFVFYFKSLKTEEPHAVSLIYVISLPLFVFVLGRLFLGDALNIREAFGFILLIGAGVLGVIRFDSQVRFRWNLLWTVLATFIWAVSDVVWAVIVKEFPSSGASLIWLYLGGGLAGFVCMLLPGFRSRTRLADMKFSRGGWLVFTLGMLFSTLGYFTFLKALSFERVSLVTVLLTMQPLFVFFFALLYRSISKAFEKVDLRLSVIWPKLLGMLIAVAGIILIKGF